MAAMDSAFEKPTRELPDVACNSEGPGVAADVPSTSVLASQAGVTTRLVARCNRARKWADSDSEDDGNSEIDKICKSFNKLPALPSRYTCGESINLRLSALAGEVLTIESVDHTLVASMLHKIRVKMGIPHEPQNTWGTWFGHTPMPKWLRLFKGPEELQGTETAKEVSDQNITVLRIPLPDGAEQQIIVSRVSRGQDPDAVFEEMCTEQTRRLLQISRDFRVFGHPNSPYQATARLCLIEPNPEARPPDCPFCSRSPCRHGVRCTGKNFSCSFCHRALGGSCDICPADWQRHGSLLRQIDWEGR
ncbi:unnamed protein product [Symbiodinium pilosum]|uniref:Uncharacterized protein n=1 Tax=Symbiodinium pilosum TaxID=2952 RepID=A0A812JU46_SYMPI|nr:unnamed protein product [Symbiodinium pilosum]